ncbi:MAG: TetR/AcrR family transcriptional regulator [Desulfobacterales bacterium]|nr:TetR/AcrR family transcriptional regulator [Desulfobacterales bacterium]
MPPIPELEAIRKAQILEAGLKTIAARGCASVTMEEICRAAGMSKGGLAHYYKSKRDLFKAVFREFFQRVFKRSRETMARFEGPLDKVLSFDWLYDMEDPDAVLGYPILFNLMSMAVHDEEYRRMFHEWVENWVEMLGEALREGVSRGVFTELDPDEAARSISAIYQGVASRWYLDRASHPDRWAVETFTKGIMGVLTPHIQKSQPPIS